MEFYIRPVKINEYFVEFVSGCGLDTQNPHPNTQKIPYPFPNTQKIPYPFPNTQKN